MIYKKYRYYTEEDNCAFPDEGGDGKCIKMDCNVMEINCPHCKNIIK